MLAKEYVCTAVVSQFDPILQAIAFSRQTSSKSGFWCDNVACDDEFCPQYSDPAYPGVCPEQDSVGVEYLASLSNRRPYSAEVGEYRAWKDRRQDPWPLCAYPEMSGLDPGGGGSHMCRQSERSDALIPYDLAVKARRGFSDKFFDDCRLDFEQKVSRLGVGELVSTHLNNA